MAQALKNIARSLLVKSNKQVVEVFQAENVTVSSEGSKTFYTTWHQHTTVSVFWQRSWESWGETNCFIPPGKPSSMSTSSCQFLSSLNPQLQRACTDAWVCGIIYRRGDLHLGCPKLLPWAITCLTFATKEELFLLWQTISIWPFVLEGDIIFIF